MGAVDISNCLFVPWQATMRRKQPITLLYCIHDNSDSSLGVLEN